MIPAAARALLLAAATSSLAVPIVAGHEAGKLVVEPAIARPGDTLTIHAEALWTEVPVTVSIVDDAGEKRAIGSSTTSDAGALEMAARLPDDVRPGTWEVLVENDAGEHVEGQVVVRASDPPILAIVAGLGVLVGVVLLVAFLFLRALRGQAAASSTS